MRIALARRNEALDALRDNFNSGLMRIYDGTRPTDADTALSGNTLLAQLTLNATSFPAASGGVLTANAITGDTSADATGTASFVRIYESDGTTPICDLSVSTIADGTGEVQFPTLSFVAGVAVDISSFTITLPVGT
jgi:hypothetical protein